MDYVSSKNKHNQSDFQTSGLFIFSLFSFGSFDWNVALEYRGIEL